MTQPPFPLEPPRTPDEQPPGAGERRSEQRWRAGVLKGLVHRSLRAAASHANSFYATVGILLVGGATLVLIDEIRRQHPKDFGWTGITNRLTGSDMVRRAIEEGWLPRLLEERDREAANFKRDSAPYLMYE